MKQYYNTNELEGDMLDEAEDSNMKQQDLVLKFFQDHPTLKFATFEIRKALMPDAPHTSAQRCISNLTELGKLVKTDDFINGPYNKPVHVWKLVIDNSPASAFFNVK